MTLTLIAAAGENNELGKNNDLVWHLPDDFARFKMLTSGHHIIMGRKTFESFPKPLPNRIHVVITRDKNYHIDHEQCIVVHSLEKAIQITEKDNHPFVIGGGEIYKMALAYADKIELTRVHATFDADTFFPEIPKEDWVITEFKHHPKDERHQYCFSYLTYVKKDSQHLSS
ncbi:dihydrofolate reductase [Mesonia sp. K7]|uniref:dihydrofolate reductase n=1 Tax=Mesonia sp. K7 TaxID=2218606 RepID=UPI000DA8E72D|nr:dihydrofolate reductase [Mesonia sp. K7]PZD78643.1 dihydrofolate reductase [Mesonia sp. K7]